MRREPVHMSPRQRHVVERMREGWELGKSSGGGYWIQKGGLGWGGPSESVHASTAHALWTRGVIEEWKKDYPTFHYRLTKAWR